MSSELLDASFGSLPTLIVPDDPENGVIERPRTPPPVEIDVARLPPAVMPNKHAAPAVVANERFSDTRVKSDDAIEIAMVTSDREPPVSVTDAGGATTAAMDAPSFTAAAAAPGLVSVSPSASLAPIVSAANATPASTSTPTPSSAPQQQQLSSKDYATMAKRAQAVAKLDRLAGGSKSVLDADMRDIGALGIGMQLYFMLTKYLSVTFLLMGVAALPTIVVNLYGHGVTDKLVDPLQLAYASLGNQGVNDDIASDPRQCLPKGAIDCNGTTVDTPFTTDPVTVAWIITISDCVYSGIFLIFCIAFRVNATRAIESHLTENLTPAKFAVFVRGLPPDATVDEILEHFNTRFDPTQADEYFPLFLSCCWGRRRRKVNRALAAATTDLVATNQRVVTNLDHLAATTLSDKQKEMYLNTWIAEVSIGHPTGGLLRTFLSMEALTKGIAETQELIAILELEKATSDPRSKKTAFKPADEKLLQTATTKLEKLHAALAKKTSKIKALQNASGDGANAAADKPAPAPATSNSQQVIPGLDATTIEAGAGTGAAAIVQAAKKATTATENAFNWDACQCAFVVFNTLESRRRCLRDYRKSTWFFPHRYQPRSLRFRNGKYRLIVTSAPEPSNILWENLETTDRGRFYRRSLTNLVTFLLLLFSCAIISGAQSAQATFKAKMPPAGLCDWSLPQVFYGNDSFFASSRIKWQLVWDQNATCAVGPQNEPKYHIAYSNGILHDFAFANPVTPTKASVLHRCTDPCIAETSSVVCNTLPCFDQDRLDAGDNCETYLESHMLYCFCTDALTKSIDAFGVIDGPQQLWTTFLPCRGFITDYMTKNAFIVAAAGVVVLVNLVLKAILRAFATFERHASESAKASAIALKMFSAQFLNTAVIVLVVNAAIGASNVPLVSELFNGKYKDFERDWYPTVGMGITMTMLLNACVPHCILCVQMFVLAPLLKCLKRRSIRTQAQMNKLYAGPHFDIAVRYPMLLNSVFVTMAFSGGSPILLFIAAIAAAATYWFDKLSLIYLYSIKTAYDEALGEIALALLPWTLVLHLGFSTWMYGNTALVQSPQLDVARVLKVVGYKYTPTPNATTADPTAVYTDVLAYASKIDVLGEHGFMVKIVHASVVTMFVCFVAVVAGILLSTLWLQVLLPILTRTVFLAMSAIWRVVQPRLVRFVAKCCCCCFRRASHSSAGKHTAKVAVDNTQTTTTAAAVLTAPVSPLYAVDGRGSSIADTNGAVASSDTAAADPSVLLEVGSVPAPASAGMATMTTPSALGTVQLLTSKSALPVSPIASPRSPRSHQRVVPMFTDVFCKSVPRRYKPDTKLGFAINADGNLVRTWQDETILNGLTRHRGEPMRTWEAMQAPVKIYAIEANAKYRLAVNELVAAAKRGGRTATTALSKIEPVGSAGAGAIASTERAITQSVLATESVPADTRTADAPASAPSLRASGQAEPLAPAPSDEQMSTVGTSAAQQQQPESSASASSPVDIAPA